MNVNALRSFHHRIGNTGDVEINVLVIHRKVEPLRAITIFEMTIFLHFVQSSFHRFSRSIVTFQDAFFFLFRRLPRSIGRTKFSLRLTNNLWGHKLLRSIINGFSHQWVKGIGLACKNQVEVLLQVTAERVFQLVHVQLWNPDHFLLFQMRSCFKEIFGGGRRDKHCLSYNFSPFFNLSTFTIQWAGSVL